MRYISYKNSGYPLAIYLGCLMLSLLSCESEPVYPIGSDAVTGTAEVRYLPAEKLYLAETKRSGEGSFRWVYSFNNPLFKSLFPDSLAIFSIGNPNPSVVRDTLRSVCLGSSLVLRPTIDNRGHSSVGNPVAVEATWPDFIGDFFSLPSLSGNYLGTQISNNTGLLLVAGNLNYYRIDLNNSTLSVINTTAPTLSAGDYVSFYHDGKAYLTGGTITNITVRYDFTTGIFDTLQTGLPGVEGAWVAKSGDHFYAGHGKVGGIANAKTWKFNTNLLTWQDISDLFSFEPKQASSAFAFGDSIVVAGGLNPANAQDSRQCLSFNTTTFTWRKLPDMPFTFQGCGYITRGNTGFTGYGVVKNADNQRFDDCILGYDAGNKQWFLYYDGTNGPGKEKGRWAFVRSGDKYYMFNKNLRPGYTRFW